jgi:hypothetical protein
MTLVDGAFLSDLPILPETLSVKGIARHLDVYILIANEDAGVETDGLFVWQG